MIARQSVGRSVWLLGAFVVALASPAAQSQVAIAGKPAPQESQQRAYLGVYLEGEAEGGGVTIGEVVAGSPAEKAGLQAGDVIVALGERTVGSEDELRDAIVATGAGQRVRISFVRDGEKRRTSARLAASPDEMEQAEDEAGEERPSLTPVEVGPRAPAQAGGYLGVELAPAESGGALVSNVVEGSPAERAGLESGDVIVQVGSDEIESVEGLVSTIRSHKSGDSVRLVVERDGGRKTIKATLGARSAAGAPAGGTVRSAPEPQVERPAPRAGGGTGGANLERAQQEIRELRAQVDELRRKCDQQQRALDAIRRALDGTPERDATSMAVPGAMAPSHPSLVSGLARVAGSTDAWTVLAPSTAPIATTAGVAVSAGPAVAGEACVAGAGGTCSGVETCCTDDGTMAVASMNGVATLGEAPTSGAMVIAGTGEGSCCEAGTTTIMAGDASITTYGAASDDACCQVAGQDGIVFQVVTDDRGAKNVKAVKSKSKVKAEPKVKAQKIKLGGAGVIQLEPKVKALPKGNVDVRVEGLGKKHPAVIRIPRVGTPIVAPHGVEGVKVRTVPAPVRAPVRMRSLQPSKSECTGGCPNHCGQGQVRSIAFAGEPTELRCDGPCTIVIRCDGETVSLDDTGAFEFMAHGEDECAEECEDSCSGCGGDCSGCCAEPSLEAEINLSPFAVELGSEEVEGTTSIFVDITTGAEDGCCESDTSSSCEDEDEDEDEDDDDDDEDDDDEPRINFYF